MGIYRDDGRDWGRCGQVVPSWRRGGQYLQVNCNWESKLNRVVLICVGIVVGLCGIVDVRIKVPSRFSIKCEYICNNNEL